MNDTPNLNRKHGVVGALIGTVLLLAIAAGVLVYGNRIVDNVLASRFVANSKVQSIHDNLKLTTEGSNLLYASAPAIETGSAFNQDCESSDRTQAILGCYSMRKIYLYDIVNPQLAGAEESTAAHEMLHAAYERLTIFERPAIDKMITDEYAKLKNDPELAKLVAYYEKNEPGAVNNELHSIIGTTVADLPPALEKYYARYFTDRAAIVAMNQSYTAVFKQVEQRSQEIAAQIGVIKPKIDTDLQQYSSDLQQLEADITVFNAQVKSGTYKTQSAFNAARQALVVRVSAMNARRDSLNNDIATYNALVAEQTKLSVQVNQLNSSINAAPSAGGV